MAYKGPVRGPEGSERKTRRRYTRKGEAAEGRKRAAKALIEGLEAADTVATAVTLPGMARGLVKRVVKHTGKAGAKRTRFPGGYPVARSAKRFGYKEWEVPKDVSHDTFIKGIERVKRSDSRAHKVAEFVEDHGGVLRADVVKVNGKVKIIAEIEGAKPSSPILVKVFDPTGAAAKFALEY